MKAIKLITCLLFAVATTATAQTYRQRGVVRMITTSAESPIRPVEGVKVAVGNNVSEATGADGVFTLSVAKQFQVNGVAPSDEYILALPTKGKSYTHSPNDLDVVVTTKTQQQADYKRLYNDLKKKYRQQTRELDDLRQDYKDQWEAQVDDVVLKAKYDSLQTLYHEYISNEERIDAEIKKLAEGLSITDYQTLDSIERRIYDLKCAGEWKSISDLMHDVMHGDAAAYLKEKIENKRLATEQRKAAELVETNAERDSAMAIKFMEETIKAFEMQHLNDSVSKYYKILTDAAPEKWEYLNNAGSFESEYMARYDLAMGYYTKAKTAASCDTMLATTYNNIALIHAHREEYEKALEYMFKSFELLTASYGNVHPNIASLHNNIAVVYNNMGDFEKAKEHHQIALDMRKELFGEKSPEIAHSLFNIGGLYNGLGDITIAKDYCERALAMWQETSDENNPDLATCYGDLGELLWSSHIDEEKGQEYLDKAIEIKKTLLGECHPAVADEYISKGKILLETGDVQQAGIYFEKALKCYETVYGEEHSKVIGIYHNIGNVFSEQSIYDKARQYYEKALEVSQKLTDNNLLVASCLERLGGYYKDIGDYSKAVDCTEQALNIYINTCGENHASTAPVYNTLGLIYIETGETDKVSDCFNKALQIYLEIFGERHPKVSSSYNNLGMVFDHTGDYGKALEYYKKSLAITKAIYGDRHRTVSIGLNNIASVYFNQGLLDQALETFMSSLDICIATYGEMNFNTSTIYANISCIYEQSKAYDKALEYLEKALKIQIELFGDNHINIASIYDEMGRICYTQKKYAEAQTLYEKVLKIIVPMIGENNAEVQKRSYNLALAFHHQGKYEAALEYLKKSFDIAVQNWGEESSSAKVIKKDMAFCLYYVAVDKKDYDSLKRLAVKCTVLENGPASQAGLSGEYYLLELGDWTIDSDDKNFMTVNELLLGKPKDVVFYRDGVIVKKYFDSSVGIRTIIVETTKEEKQKIVAEYHKYKRQDSD